MRVTPFIIYDRLLSDMKDGLRKLGDAQEQLSSGQRINKPSDDVVGMSKAVDYKVSINSSEQYEKNIDEATSQLSIAESSLNSALSVIKRLQELSMLGASDNIDAVSKAALGEEVANLKLELSAIANTKINDRYIFSGFQTSTATYSDASGIVLDTGEIMIKMDDSAGTKIAVNVTASRAFALTQGAPQTVDFGGGLSAAYTSGGGTTVNVVINKPGGGSDSFSFSNMIEMTGLLADALKNNDTDRVRALMHTVSDAFNQVNGVRADIGSRLSSLDSQKNRLQDNTLVMQGILSKIQDADITETISDITKADIALQALRGAAGSILSQSLMDFLKL